MDVEALISCLEIMYSLCFLLMSLEILMQFTANKNAFFEEYFPFSYIIIFILSWYVSN